MVTQHYRWDFIGLSTDEKPTPATSEKVVDGSTFYCSDNSKLYVYYKDQWYEKEATGGGGTTYEDFVGTDGETAGTHGLVPAPAITDVGKFLKADGTWGEAGGGGIRTLTSADYDYHYSGSTDDGIALWRLPSGCYKKDSGVKVYTSATFIGGVIVPAASENFLNIYVSASSTVTIVYGDSSGYLGLAAARPLTGDEISLGTPGLSNILTGKSVVNDLTSSAKTASPLSAAQGYTLDQKIGDLSSLTTTDKTSIVAAINELAARL